MTRKRIPCTLWSRVIGPSSHSGSLGRVVTLGKIGPMAFFFVHEKCQHYYESGQSRSSQEDRLAAELLEEIESPHYVSEASIAMGVCGGKCAKSFRAAHSGPRSASCVCPD